MRIEKLDVAHFGRLRDRQIALGPGMNLLVAPNESGKSTLAAFIRFMLYGPPAGRATSLNPVTGKTRYEPWTGEAPSGGMTYSADGARYILSRTQKRVGCDLSLYDADTGAPAALDDEPGRRLFGVSGETYDSTAFFGQSALSSLTMGEIDDKLRNIVTGADEAASYETAKKRLEEALRALCTPQRKGALDSARRELQTLEDRLARAREDARVLEQVRGERRERQKKSDDAARECTELAAQAAQLREAAISRAAKHRLAAQAAIEELARAQKERTLRTHGVTARRLDEAADDISRYEAARDAVGALPEKPDFMAKARPGSAVAAGGAGVDFGSIAGCILAAGGGVLLWQRIWIWGAVLVAAGLAVFTLYRLTVINVRREKARAYNEAMNAYSDRQCEEARLHDKAADFFAQAGEIGQEEWRPYIDRLRGDLAQGAADEVRLDAMRADLARLTPEAVVAADGEYLRAAEGAQRAERLAGVERERLAVLAERERNLAASSSPPDAVCGEINALSMRLDAMEAQYAALSAARDALEAAHTGMSRLFTPRLAAAAGARFTAITGDGRELVVDDAGGVRISEGGLVRDMAYFSVGARDSAYIALRLALVELLYAGQTPPLIFDSSFDSLDDLRARGVIEMLDRLSDRFQILLLSCRPLEGLVDAGRCFSVKL